MSEERHIDTTKRMQDLLARLSFRPMALNVKQRWELESVLSSDKTHLGWLVTTIFEMEENKPGSCFTVIGGWPVFIPIDAPLMSVVRRLRQACLDILTFELDRGLMWDNDAGETRAEQPYHHHAIFDPEATLADVMSPHVKRYIDSIP